MAQLIFQGFYDDLEAGTVTDAVDIRIMAVMTDTTCDTEVDAQTLSDFSNIDECDGVGYAQLDLLNVTVAYDDTNDMLKIDADDGDLDGGGDVINVSTRDVQGLVCYRYVDGTDANDVPWWYLDVGPYTLGGGPFDITWHTNGVTRIKTA